MLFFKRIPLFLFVCLFVDIADKLFTVTITVRSDEESKGLEGPERKGDSENGNEIETENLSLVLPG